MADDQILYVQLLQEKNRLLKRIKQKKQPPEEVDAVGFTTYFSGANEERAKKLAMQAKLRQAERAAIAAQAQAKTSSGGRRQWGPPSMTATGPLSSTRPVAALTGAVAGDLPAWAASSTPAATSATPLRALQPSPGDLADQLIPYERGVVLL